jgi:hypothetical protein
MNFAGNRIFFDRMTGLTRLRVLYDWRENATKNLRKRAGLQPAATSFQQPARRGAKYKKTSHESTQIGTNFAGQSNIF